MAVGSARSAPGAGRDGPSSLPPYVLPRTGGSVWESNPPPTCLEPDTGFEVRGVHRRRKRLHRWNYLSDQQTECSTGEVPSIPVSLSIENAVRRRVTLGRR